MSEEKNAILEKMTASLFGGLDEMREQISELYNLFNHKYNQGQIANALTWMTLRFTREGDKSSYALVDQGQLCRKDNLFNKEDALLIYKYVAKKTFKKGMPDASEEFFEHFYESLGNHQNGATTNIIPGGYGEYGLSVTNPIPTRGIPSNEIYLQRLSLLSDEPFHWERIGSFGSPNIEHPIDGYEIISEKGERLCTIYISPYQQIISNKAPKGFYVK